MINFAVPYPFIISNAYSIRDGEGLQAIPAFIGLTLDARQDTKLLQDHQLTWRASYKTVGGKWRNSCVHEVSIHTL